MGGGLARTITIGSIVLTVVSLTFAVVFARKCSRIRVAFDLARGVVGVVAILVMAAITQVTTPGVAIAVAIAVGLGLGFAQGSSLDVSAGERGFYSKRSPVGIVLWGAGIVIMQAAGIAARTGTVRVGQTISWFSACLGIGLMVGRSGPLQNAKRAFVGTGIAALLATLLVPLLLPGAAPAVAAETPQLTDDEVCNLIVPETSDRLAAADTYDPLPGRDFDTWADWAEPLAPVVNSIAACRQPGYEVYTGQGEIEYTIYLFASVSDAQAQYSAEVAANEAWYAPQLQEAQEWFAVYDTGLYKVGAGSLDEYGVTGLYWIAGQEERVAMMTGPFMLYGVVTDNLAFDFGPMRADRTHEPDGWLIETLITPMADTLHNIETVMAASEPSAEEDDESSSPAPVDAGDGGDAVAPGTNEDESEGTAVAPPPITAGDEPIEPEQAAGQAVAGLVAAAAIGLITWAEAAAEIGRIIGGLGDRSVIPPGPTEPFIDPLDQQPLITDPATGMVFWPWDGGEGHWVNPSEMPGLLDAWNRQLDAETARRVAAHNAQRKQNWADLQDRIRRSEAEDAARRAAEKARLDDFDRRIEAARGWMEQDDAASLGVLDRITKRVANQGFATDADIAEANRVLDRARGYSTTLGVLDADAWAVIEGNAVAVAEVSIKAATIILDPTFGLGSGFAWGAVESLYDGDSIPKAALNGTLNGALWAGGYKVATWGPGRAAFGPITWGAGTGAAMGATDTILHGGSLSDAWEGAKRGFVGGGLGGIAERVATIGVSSPPELPTIRTRTGGPRVGYSNPRQPWVAPPERGGVGVSSPATPRIVVEPGGPRVGYDQPLDPQRHVDGADPRYEPWDPRYRPPEPPPRLDPEGPPAPRPTGPAEPTPVDAITEPPAAPPAGRPPTEYPPGGPPEPPQLIEVEGGPLGGRPPSAPPEVTAPDVVGETNLVDLPESPPPPAVVPEPPPPAAASRPPVEAPSIHDPPAQRPSSTMHGSEIVDNVMKQPDVLPQSPRPAAPTLPSEMHPTLVDADGGVVVGDRLIGRVDTEGTLRNLNNEPIRIAEDLYTGKPVGYLEQPRVPEGMSPAYNSRGELVGHVDADGYATIGGEQVKVAIDHRGNLVPYDGPLPGQGPVPQHLPPENLRAQSRLPGTDVEPVTGAGTSAGGPITPGEPPATGSFDSPQAAMQPIDHTPYGQPITAGDGRPPIGLPDLDVNPRIPVLDESGAVTHFVEPGPREIHYDAGGNPVFVQRQFPAEPPLMTDTGLDMANFPGARMMPAPENFVVVESRTLLTGPGAPPPAPDVIPPTPPGGELP